MTHAEADNLIATLPKPGGLRLYREGDWIMMAGGKHGGHSIAVRPSSAERLLVHWKGYVKNQGQDLGPGPFAVALGSVSQLARNAYKALCGAKRRSLALGSLARKVGAGRWKHYSHTDLAKALHELAKIGLVTSDGYGRYTAVCDEAPQ
jgi:hypothetical protein